MIRSAFVFTLTSVVCLTVVEICEAQGACVSGQVSSITTTQVQACSGNDHFQLVDFDHNAQIRANVSCDDNGWRTASSGWTSAGVTAQGSCENASAGTPAICAPGFNGPYYWGWSDGRAEFRTNFQDGETDSDGWGCIYGNWQTYGHYINIEGCCHPTCQDSTACNLIGEYDGANCRCYVSPVILDLDGGGLQLTNASDGVHFDLACSGQRPLTSWTRPGSGDGFLALDRNGNGTIDNGCELFGSVTKQDRIPKPNGFNALAAYDINKDQAIDWIDPTYSLLRIWVDSNHDGVSQPSGLHYLNEFGLSKISLDYRESRAQDTFGNILRYRSHVVLVRRSHPVTETAYDVFLLGLGPDRPCRPSNAK